jgi:hypothetical protein
MAAKDSSMPTETKLGIVVGLGLLIFSAVIAAQRPGGFGGSSSISPAHSIPPMKQRT